MFVQNKSLFISNLLFQPFKIGKGKIEYSAAVFALHMIVGMWLKIKAIGALWDGDLLNEVLLCQKAEIAVNGCTADFGMSCMYIGIDLIRRGMTVHLHKT